MNDDFKKLTEMLSQGQDEIIFNTKSLLYKYYPDLFDVLDFNNDRIFLEPLLIGFFTMDHKKMSIHQILFGYISEEKRPNKIKVFADEYGIVYLPNLGYLKTGISAETLTLEYEDRSTISLFRNEKELIDHAFESLYFVEKVKEIEVCYYSNPIYSEILNEWHKIEMETADRVGVIPNRRSNYLDHYPFIENMKKDTKLICENLEKALLLIKKYSYTDFQNFTRSTKKIVCFNNPYMRGFVTKNVHGTAFISVASNSNEIFFLDEVVHQCSHNAFNAMTSDANKFFRIDKEFSMKTLSNRKEGENRTFYGAFHGLFTVSSGIRILTKIYRNHSFCKSKLFQLYGRLAVKKNRFRNGLQNLDLKNIFTSEGYFIYDLLDTTSYNILINNPDIFTEKNNFDGQPPVLSDELFLEKNKQLPNHPEMEM